MNHYLTISEFAKLRGVTINSLLYYEKLGILLPAYTDPHSKYRYYAPEQLSALDIILICTKSSNTVLPVTKSSARSY